MPTLDVSELLDDPTFVEKITVIRREEQITPKGRTAIIPTIIPDVLASVQPKDTVIGGNVVLREADYEIRGSNVNVYTKFRLRSAAQVKALPTNARGKQFQPDIIVWNGDHFQVELTNDFSHYGAGYMHAECSSVEIIDYAPDGAPIYSKIVAAGVAQGGSNVQGSPS